MNRILRPLLAGAFLAFAAPHAWSSLADYDGAIANDAAGGLSPTAKLTADVSFTGTNFYAFDFGPISGDAAFEFIVEGTPASVGGYLAVGANSSSNLRFEQHPDTAQLGFTQLGVADYLFSPAVPTPAQPRHVVYLWDGNGTMQLYVDGAIAGSRAGVSSSFAMPTGNGRLGSNPSGGEGMTGTIHRVTAYATMLSPEAIRRHADAFLGIVRGPSILQFTASPAFIQPGATSELRWEVTDANAVALDGMGVAATGTLTVSPTANATYTLEATNAAGTTSEQATVTLIRPAAHLVISEFMAENKSVLADEDGEFSDWIEVHNPTASSVTLAGWFLTDEAEAPRKWAFPAATLAAGGYLVVFASEKARAAVGAPLHTNFKLSKGGEYLALTNGAGVAHAFSPAFPAQEEDISFGLVGSDPALSFSFSRPTPGGPNDTASVQPLPVRFSVPSGPFTGALDVVLSTDTPGAEIFYTINGSPPSRATGSRYTAPITISTTTRLRAVAIANGQVSRTSAAHYVRLAADLAGYSSPLPLMIIENFGQGVVPQKGWSGNGSGIQQVPRQAAYWATFERAGGTAALTAAPQMQGSIAIRGRGAFSTSWDQKPFSVESVDESGAEAEVAPLGLPAHADWVLYYPDSDSDKDPTLLFNTFPYALSAACGRYAARFRFVEVFVHEDGGDLSLSDRRGVYVLLEKVSRGPDRLDFTKLSPDGTSGSWLVNINRMDAIPESGWPAPNGATTPQFFHTPGPNRILESAPNGPVAGDDLPQQWNALINFDNPSGYEITAPQRAAIEGWVRQFEAVFYDNAQWRNPTTGYRVWLDARDFAEFFIFNTLTRNGDGLLISMFPWRGDDGLLRMGPVWDFNYAAYYVGGAPTGDLRWRAEQLWYPRLFADPDFNQLFIDRWSAFRRGPMNNAAMAALIDAQAAEITPAKAVQQGIGSAATWQGRLDQMKTWLQTRANWIDSQFAATPQLSHAGGNVPANFSLNITAPAGTIYYMLDGTDPRAAGGGVAPGAQTALPVSLNGVARVIARAKTATAWSGAASGTFVAGVAPATSANLAIVEIHYHPAPAPGVIDPAGLEFIELQNFGPETVSLLGLKLVRVGTAGVEFDFSTGTVLMLSAGQRAIVVKNRAAFETHYGTALPVTGEFNGSLGNGGDTLRLLDADGSILRSFTYGDGAPWPGDADGNGYSLVLTDPTANPGSAANWRTSVGVGGTPGAGDALPAGGPALGYAFGTETPSLTFDSESGMFSYARRPGSDAVILNPEFSRDLRMWESGVQWFVFVGQTRGVDGSMHETWAVQLPAELSEAFFRVRVTPR